MKKSILLLLLVFSCQLFAQNYESDWKEVIKYEQAGKTQSANNAVDRIYKKAKRKNNETQIIKCFFYLSKFELAFNEKAQDTIIRNLKIEINTSSKSSKAILNYIYASILINYYEHNYYENSERTSIVDYKNKDLKTWSNDDFKKEIITVLDESLKNEEITREIPLKNYSEILQISPYTSIEKLSLYDFLHNKYVSYIKKQVNNYEVVRKLKNDDTISGILYSDSKDFINSKINFPENLHFEKLIQTYQTKERYYSSTNSEKNENAYFERIKYIHSIFSDEKTYLAKIRKLEKLTKNEFLKQQLKFERAEYYYTKTNKENKINLYNEALSLIDSILKIKVNPQVLSDAEELKFNITSKSLTINLKKIIYPNENTRAFVEFQNIDSIKISYYRIPNKMSGYFSNNYRKKSDSLITNYALNHKPFKTFIQKLPNKKDYFNYSTEILLEKLDVGNYLIFIETENDSKNGKKVFSYENIVVTNFSIIQDSDKTNDYYFLSDRKNGKPIANAVVKIENEIANSDSFGKVVLPKKAFDGKKKNKESIYLIKENDTLTIANNRNYLYADENSEEELYEKYQTKAMVFFDRAIYRPGQKVFYKGVLLKSNGAEKSVVPFVTIHVIINNASGEIAKELDVQTNEFGSFTGEFEIPKNCLTGNFSLEIDEGEKIENDTHYYNSNTCEHSFWNTVQTELYRDFRFKVEEYKRPTFEINFDKIKENYTIGDIVNIKGNAKSLAGNTITNAKVVYSISKNSNDGYERNKTKANYTTSETFTDEKGNFNINFTAKDSLEIENSQTIKYIVNCTITDINGETRTASTLVNVGKNTLKLELQVEKNLLIEEKKSLKIYATTLNNFPIDAKGEIKIYEHQGKTFLKEREFSRSPDIEIITKQQFELLFPHEPYNEEERQPKPVLVKTISFNTKIDSSIDLSFLNLLNKGFYTIVATSKDSKNNEITANAYFNLNSKINPNLNNELFAYKDISNSKLDYYEFEILSLIPDLYITSRFYENDISKNIQVIQLENGSRKIKIKKNKNHHSDVYFQFSTVWENKKFDDDYSILKEDTVKKLTIESISLRNKIEPGSIENWSFKILDNKQEAEVLASMYDSSLDLFTKQDWENLEFYNRFGRPDFPNFNEYNVSSLFFNDFYSEKKYNAKDTAPTNIYWFGFDFTNPNNKNSIKIYNELMLRKYSYSPNAKSLKGTVSDTDRRIPGVRISIKGTKLITVTNFNGEFSIKAKKGNVLVIQFIGMKPIEVKIENLKKLDIVISENELNLNKVVVRVEHIKRLPKELAYAAKEVKTMELTQAAPVRAVTALKGKVSGLNVLTKNNGVNPTAGIVLRGYKSLSGNNQAIIVLDGVIQDSAFLNNLNPDDILSVQVMNSSNATVLYGSEGSNGALIVTTKKMMQEVSLVKTRTNFNETAFFYPNLKTDTEGKITFSFTTPESLTKWKLRLFAHNKKAEVGYFQSEIVSQKEVMIMPNMPRFVREKDTIVISAKVVNMTNEGKSGVAMLLLYDATTMKTIDTITLNSKNYRNFSCKPKESVVVNWTITIPDGLEGLQYKIVAKSGNFTDGEENILPVLSNKILVTESIPLWVRENTKKEVVFENLKNASSTLKNHLFTLEYTSNPVWFAIQSLPYLMEYEHECAEQTFARYYANCIATEIITSNPKVAEVFESWKKEGNTKSKLEMNAELKSIILAETPWFFDTDEETRNKQLAVLFDLNTLKQATDETFKKLEQKLLPTGGFPWFDGGKENVYISQHILSGIGHLIKMFPKTETKYKTIITKGIPNLDARFIESSKLNKEKVFVYNYADLHYLYTRSFYLNNYPLSPKLDSIVSKQLTEVKKNWLHYSLYQKGMLALVMHRYKEHEFAKKIITSLKQTAAHNLDNGMYWIENKNGYRWYESSVETQALLIEAFSEIENDKKNINELKVWLIKNKQSKNWATTKATTEAIYALMLKGSDWTSIKDNTKFVIGDDKILSKKLTEKDKEAATGYIKMSWNADEINKEMATISVDNKSDIPGYGGVYWQYFEELENVKQNTNKELSVSKELYKKIKTTEGNKLVSIADEKLKVGDLITVRLILKTDTDLEFVHLKDLRASCFEPVDVISGYKWNDLSYYMSTKDVATHFFFDSINKGTYVLEYDVRINNLGSFNNGIATLQSMYAPEFKAHSVSGKVKISE